MSHPLECLHEDRVWSPVIISRWDDPRMGVTKHLCNISVCEECTKRITLRDVLTDDAWAHCQRMLRRQGMPQLVRHLNQLRWESKDSTEREFKSAQSRVVERMEFPISEGVDPATAPSTADHTPAEAKE